MTKHSTLVNADDLHYAKVRSFTGDPNAITPNFVDQILTATDTNKVYRANGLTIGSLTQLVGAEPVSEWIFLDWGDYDTTVEAQVNKKYIKQKEGDIILLLPTNPAIGNTINIRTITQNGNLYLDSQGMEVTSAVNITGNNSPFYPQGNILNPLYIRPYASMQLIFVQGSKWVTISDGGIEFISYIPPVFGCTDSAATNYDPLATGDDGSCTY